MKQRLRRAAKWAGILLVIGGGGWFVAPYVLGFGVDLTCITPPDAGCQARMLALGNMWAARGNLEKAKGWYTQAAGGPDPAALFDLGWAYGEAYRAAMTAKPEPYRGEAAETGARAIQWYEAAAKAGFAPAANNLGEIYAFGLGVPVDAAAAHRLHLQAAEAGNPAGAANTAIDFAIGRGVDRDAAQAEHWSTIEPAHAAPVDLEEPIFARTLVYGNPLPAEKRREIRAAAANGTSVTFSQSPLPPGPDLPAFQAAADLLKKPSEP